MLSKEKHHTQHPSWIVTITCFLLLTCGWIRLIAGAVKYLIILAHWISSTCVLLFLDPLQFTSPLNSLFSTRSSLFSQSLRLCNAVIPGAGHGTLGMVAVRLTMNDLIHKMRGSLNRSSQWVSLHISVAIMWINSRIQSGLFLRDPGEMALPFHWRSREWMGPFGSLYEQSGAKCVPWIPWIPWIWHQASCSYRTKASDMTSFAWSAHFHGRFSVWEGGEIGTAWFSNGAFLCIQISLEGTGIVNNNMP